MAKHRTVSSRYASLGLAALAALALAAPVPLRAQASTSAARANPAPPTSGLRAELISDVNEVEQKFLALADAMSGHYDWRPGTGVRSVSEVFMHVAGANFMIPTMAGVPLPDSLGASQQDAMQELQGWESITDEARVKSALRQSFEHVRQAIAATPDARLDDKATFFGQPATKRQVLVALVAHMHEHLGQSIAYARTNGVVPPWSAGGGR